VSLNQTVIHLMHKPLLTACSLLAVFWAVVADAALERISDFALLDNTGTFHQLSRYQHRRAVVMMAYVPGCAAMPALVQALLDVRTSTNDEAVEFLLLDSLDSGRERLQQIDAGLPLLEDDGQLVSETLGLTHAGQVLVMNPQRLSLFYRGAVVETLAEVLAQAVDGSVVDTISTADLVHPEGADCEIAYPRKAAHVEKAPDYATEVAPILLANCAECHRQGGVGPFALDSYLMVLGWSPMIREVLLNKRMPPAQVDPLIGHSADARYLAAQDLQTLIHWIDGGAPRGDSETDPLEAQLAVGPDPWFLGEPDYIVTGPAHQIPRTGVMDYLYEQVELPFTEDRWLRAVQFRAGDASVLHHLMTFVTAPGEDFWGEERNQESVSRRFVEGYAPGAQRAIEYPAGTGVLIPAGHRLSMQFHYVTNGQATVDTTELGLYFSAATDLTEVRTQAVSTRFELPANVADFPMLATHRFDEDVVIFGVRARMNNRGKRMKFVVAYPDGSEQAIFSVPAYNYGWQPHYLLDSPLRIPAGSTVKAIGAFDNSISNPNNPDPNKVVGFGLNSWDEMFTGYFSYYRAPK
jgi:mono/diheme cytochrome c family protein